MDPDERDYEAAMDQIRRAVQSIAQPGGWPADRSMVQNRVLDIVQEEYDRVATEAARRQFGGAA